MSPRLAPLLISILSLTLLPTCHPTPPPQPTLVLSTSQPTIVTNQHPVTPTPPPQPSNPPTSLPQTPITPTPSPHLPISPLPLYTYPRPPADNGLGIHWSTHLYAQSEEATSYFVSELTRLNIKWVKLLVDGLTNRDYDPTIEALVRRDIMPIIRIYQPCNEPYDLAELTALVQHYVGKGVFYYDLYNEPNLPGVDGGWCHEGGEPQPEALAAMWAEAARTIYLAGGYPGLPSFFAPPQKQADWPDDFFYRFFNALREQGNESVLYFSWASIHNYTINHPPTYPYDAVNQTSVLLTEAEIDRYQLTPQQVTEINRNRRVAGILKTRSLTNEDDDQLGLPPEQVAAINQDYAEGNLMGYTLYDDSTAFFHFIAYRNQFYDLFGFEIPMISTEGGATRGSGEDGRYPTLDGPTVAEWTLWTADYMLDEAPDYYLAAMTWLLAQQALDYDEPVWEANAWYHDREGDQEPVVAALKQRPRLNAVRSFCFVEERQNLPTDPVVTSDPWRWQVRLALLRDACLAERITPQPERNPLAAYPRPPADNGRGIHWIPTNQPVQPEIVDYFVTELQTMNIKWVKFLQDDQPEITHSYLIEQLVVNDIEPVLRVFKPLNEPYQHLSELVPKAKGLGVHYFELYNEPNLAGLAGGWAEGESINVERMIERWLLAAREVYAAGGHPSLPALAGGGTMDDLVFLRQFLEGIKARRQTDLLVGAWLPVHNYFLNHPLDYPTDPVNVADVPLTAAEIEARGLTPAQVMTINQARSRAKLPHEQGGFWLGDTITADSNGFKKFEAYAQVFYSRFGFYVPIISTEGGAIIGSAEDPRYPPVSEQDVTTRTLAAYYYMLDEAPPYFLAHTSWVLANQAGGHPDERFENAAWFKDREGTALAVVEALQADPRRDEGR